MIPRWFAKIEAELRPFRLAYHFQHCKLGKGHFARFLAEEMMVDCSLCDEKMQDLRDVMIEAEIEFRETMR